MSMDAPSKSAEIAIRQAELVIKLGSAAARARNAASAELYRRRLPSLLGDRNGGVSRVR